MTCQAMTRNDRFISVPNNLEKGTPTHLSILWTKFDQTWKYEDVNNFYAYNTHSLSLSHSLTNTYILRVDLGNKGWKQTYA